MRAPGRTLQSRIVWSTIGVSGIAMAAMIAVVLLVLHGLTMTNIDRRLADQASAMAATVVTDDGDVRVPETPVDSVDDTSWIYDGSGRLVEGPRTGGSILKVVESLGGVTRRTRLESMDRVFYARPVRVDGDVRAVVVVETSKEPYEQTRDVVLLGLIALGALVTAGSAAVATWTVRRTLAPVESMASRAEDWSERDLDARFEAPDTEDEFARLGRTLNVLLDRVAGALRNEQQLTAELAHELRTPLTAIRGEAELARMSGLPEDVDARVGRVIDLVDRMSSTIASLLAMARGAARTDSRTSTSELLHAARDHAPERDGVTVRVVEATDVDLPVPLDLATRALAPVVDNAVRHAVEIVTLSATYRDRSVLISVSDDGAGITADDLDTVFTSGVRGPESAGAGLGLALARRVARTLGGELEVTSRSGPTIVTLTLPQF